MRPHDRFAVLVALMLLLAVLLLVAKAYSHEAPVDWQYDSSCCSAHTASGGDCSPVPETAIRETEGGYAVLIRPGEHPMVPVGKPAAAGFLPHGDGRVRPSGDDRRHACVSRAGTILCVYIQPAGF